MSHVATELEADAVAAVVDGLHQCLAETTVETMKAQNYHWNVTGMAFGPLHDLFQKIYEDHFEAQDDIAERIKALEAHAHGKLSSLVARAKIAECDGEIGAEAMVGNLRADQETLAGAFNSLAELAEEKGDMVTNDFAIERATVHEKFAWMLRAHTAG